ncbi:MAG: hypothetical protein MUC36_11125 [Planctomycetes bacterium]|jgi:hypothetical protein|nr:hypothetical protein [Planctomycetota bacterium]
MAKAKQRKKAAADCSAQRRVTEEDADYVTSAMRLLGLLANDLRLSGIAGPESQAPREIDPDIYEATMSRRAIAATVRRFGGERMLIDGEAACRLAPLAELAHSLGLTTLEPCKLGSVHMPSALGSVGMLCQLWHRFTSSSWHATDNRTIPRDLYFDELEEDRVRARALHEIERIMQLQLQLQLQRGVAEAAFGSSTTTQIGARAQRDQAKRTVDDLGDVASRILAKLRSAKGKPVHVDDLDVAAGIRKGSRNGRKQRERALSDLMSGDLAEGQLAARTKRGWYRVVVKQEDDR